MKLYKEKRFWLLLGFCVLTFLLLSIYTIILDTADLTHIGQFVLVLWFIQLFILVMLGVFVFKLCMYLKERRKEKKTNA